MSARFAIFASAACGIALAAGLASTPAAAQTVDEVVVLGHVGKNPETLSYKVTYRDIDIRTPAGESELRRRVSVTASYICAKLGEKGTKSSCRRDAVMAVQPKIKAALDRANLQKAAWTPGPAWTPPPGYR